MIEQAQQDTGDFVIILSSDLISKVMHDYFNTNMFMMPVRVIDLQSSESGYAFTLSFENDSASIDEAYGLGPGPDEMYQSELSQDIEVEISPLSPRKSHKKKKVVHED